jgi:pentose-5-phosphate-3-epimerase
MATEAGIPHPELTLPSVKAQEVSFTLPKALHTTAHVHLNFLDHCAMVFLATSSPGDGGSIKPMGSFVYAMPDVSA